MLVKFPYVFINKTSSFVIEDNAEYFKYLSEFSNKFSVKSVLPKEIQSQFDGLGLTSSNSTIPLNNSSSFNFAPPSNSPPL